MKVTLFQASLLKTEPVIAAATAPIRATPRWSPSGREFAGSIYPKVLHRIQAGFTS